MLCTRLPRDRSAGPHVRLSWCAREHIKRIDSAVRAVVRRGAGSGRLMQLNGVIAVRQYLQERRARPTLDTPEHRWLAAQLEQIRRKLGDLRQQESVREKSERRNQALLELDQLKARIARLSRLEPIACAEGEPPSGFASLQLLAASGYREAYQHCIILSLGLRIEGGPLQLSVKDLSLLYEYWCYLALLRLISEETGKSIRLQTSLSSDSRIVGPFTERSRELHSFRHLY